MKRFTTLRYLNTLWTLSPLNALDALQTLRTGGSNQRHVLLRGHRREDLLPPVDAEERDRVHVRGHGNARDQKVTRCNGKIARIPDEHVCSNLKHRTDVRVPRSAQDDRSRVTIVVREPFHGNGRGDLGRVSGTLRALRSLWTLCSLRALRTLHTLYSLRALIALGSSGTDKSEVLIRGHCRDRLLSPVDALQGQRVGVSDHRHGGHAIVPGRVRGRWTRVPDKDGRTPLDHRVHGWIPAGTQGQRAHCAKRVSKRTTRHTRNLRGVAGSLRALRALQALEC